MCDERKGERRCIAFFETAQQLHERGMEESLVRRTNASKDARRRRLMRPSRGLREGREAGLERKKKKEKRNRSGGSERVRDKRS